MESSFFIHQNCNQYVRYYRPSPKLLLILHLAGSELQIYNEQQIIYLLKKYMFENGMMKSRNATKATNLNDKMKMLLDTDLTTFPIEEDLFDDISASVTLLDEKEVDAILKPPPENQNDGCDDMSDCQYEQLIESITSKLSDWLVEDSVTETVNQVVDLTISFMKNSISRNVTTTKIGAPKAPVTSPRERLAISMRRSIDKILENVTTNSSVDLDDLVEVLEEIIVSNDIFKKSSYKTRRRDLKSTTEMQINLFLKQSWSKNIRQVVVEAVKDGVDHEYCRNYGFKPKMNLIYSSCRQVKEDDKTDSSSSDYDSDSEDGVDTADSKVSELNSKIKSENSDDLNVLTDDSDTIKYPIPLRRYLTKRNYEGSIKRSLESLNPSSSSSSGFSSMSESSIESSIESSSRCSSSGDSFIDLSSKQNLINSRPSKTKYLSKKFRLSREDEDILKKTHLGSNPTAETETLICNLCNTHQMNAVLVHGLSGHQYACFECSQILYDRQKPCPLCRRPILLVIKTFNHLLT